MVGFRVDIDRYVVLVGRFCFKMTTAAMSIFWKSGHSMVVFTGLIVWRSM
jgi:hypothetical protein